MPAVRWSTLAVAGMPQSAASPVMLGDASPHGTLPNFRTSRKFHERDHALPGEMCIPQVRNTLRAGAEYGWQHILQSRGWPDVIRGCGLTRSVSLDLGCAHWFACQSVTDLLAAAEAEGADVADFSLAICRAGRLPAAGRRCRALESRDPAHLWRPTQLQCWRTPGDPVAQDPARDLC